MPNCRLCQKIICQCHTSSVKSQKTKSECFFFRLWHHQKLLQKFVRNKWFGFLSLLQQDGKPVMKGAWIITKQVAYVFIQVYKNKVKSKAVSVSVTNWKNKIKLILEYQILSSKLISLQCCSPHSYVNMAVSDYEYDCFKARLRVPLLFKE